MYSSSGPSLAGLLARSSALIIWRTLINIVVADGYDSLEPVRLKVDHAALLETAEKRPDPLSDHPHVLAV
jgi:hypothetical protein